MLGRPTVLLLLLIKLISIQSLERRFKIFFLIFEKNRSHLGLKNSFFDFILVLQFVFSRRQPCIFPLQENS